MTSYRTVSVLGIWEPVGWGLWLGISHEAAGSQDIRGACRPWNVWDLQLKWLLCVPDSEASC